MRVQKTAHIICYLQRDHRMSITLGQLTSEECSICSQEFSTFRCGKILTQLHCGHCFCFACLDKWSKKSRNCPQCRLQFRYFKRLKLKAEPEPDLSKPKRSQAQGQKKVVIINPPDRIGIDFQQPLGVKQERPSEERRRRDERSGQKEQQREGARRGLQDVRERQAVLARVAQRQKREMKQVRRVEEKPSFGDTLTTAAGLTLAGFGLASLLRRR